MRDRVIVEDRDADADDRATCRGSREQVLDDRALGHNHLLINGQVGALRQRGAPWKTGIDHLLARGVADDDGIVVGLLRRPGLQGHLRLALEDFEVAIQEGRRRGEGLGRRLDADELAVNGRHDALGAAERFLLIAAALGGGVAPQQDSREDQPRQHERGTERHQAMANRVTSQ